MTVTVTVTLLVFAMALRKLADIKESQSSTEINQTAIQWFSRSYDGWQLSVVIYIRADMLVNGFMSACYARGYCFDIRACNVFLAVHTEVNTTVLSCCCIYKIIL